MNFQKGATSYDLQIGKYWVSWCFLKGGNWKSYFQFSRWKLTITNRKGE